MDLDTVLDVVGSEVVEMTGPSAELSENVGHALRKKDVAGVAAVHDALCQIDATTGDVPVRVDVGKAIDGSSVDAHSQLEVGILQRAPNFHCALDCGNRVLKED